MHTVISSAILILLMTVLGGATYSGWLGNIRARRNQRHLQRWAPDMTRDRALLFLQRTFLLWHFVLGAALYWIGTAIGGSAMGISFVVWGVFVRLCFVLHSTWLVNSASHMWGYRNYETTDRSRNLWWVALVTYGEGWHNNHHAFPRMAAHGHRWWEIDLTFATIRLMQWLRAGLGRGRLPARYAQAIDVPSACLVTAELIPRDPHKYTTIGRTSPVNRLTGPVPRRSDSRRHEPSGSGVAGTNRSRRPCAVAG